MEKQTFFHFKNETLSDNKKILLPDKVIILRYLKNKL